MYVDSAYWHNSRMDFKDKKHPLFVGSCGTYHLFTKPKLPTHRPRGRLDFQILYVASGKGYFYFNGKKKLYLLGTSLSIVRKKNNVITIMVSITRKFTGYTLPGIM